MKNATIADLIINARSAAQKAFPAKTALEQQNIKLAEFATSGFDAADFPMWENTFLSEIEMLGVFSKQDSPATEAAKKAKPAAEPAKK